MQVLSLKDEELYHTAFSAQRKADWKTADAAIDQLHDRRLVGHILADRYDRRSPSMAELRSWLSSYADFPEAAGIYKRIERMPGAKGEKIEKPFIVDLWTAADGYGGSLGFRVDADDQPTPAMRRISVKIDRALRRSDPNGAEDLLYKEMEHRALPANELGDIQGRIAAGFFYAGVTGHARDLANQALSSKNPLALWVAGLTAWKQNDVPAAANAFAALAVQPGLSPSDRAAAQFWTWRALTKTGETGRAREWLEQAAKQPRNFYGLLAASLIGHDSVWSWTLPALSAKNLAVLKKSPTGWRALALIQIGQTSLAESELRHLNPQGRHELQEAMLALAETNHMPSLAVRLGGIATSDNGRRYDAALYPVPPWQPEEGFKVDRALLYAVMRRESYFNPAAVSGRGACGLMQLMPKTANLVARHKVAGGECSGRMLDPSFNMALGQKYVRHLAGQKMVGNNLLFLLAAYNGGPGKLLHWTDDRTGKDPLLFVESLPMRETRDYVQQVLMHYWTYRARLAEPMASVAQLARGEWPRYVLRDETLPAGGLRSAQIGGFEVASSLK